MIYNNVIAREVAESLLEIKAVVLNPSQPFTWASGWKSPIYCDNRKTLSHVKIRRYIKNAFVDLVSDEFPQANLIAGVATGAIAQGALIADALNLPYVYVRDKPKGHGMGNVIEGQIRGGEKAVVVEDLISTGGSSLKAAQALQEAGVEVVGLIAIFTYNFKDANEQMEKQPFPLYTLTNYPTLIAQAIHNQYIKKEEEQSLLDWYQNPADWNK